MVNFFEIRLNRIGQIKKAIIKKAVKKIKKDFITNLYVNLDFVGFLKKIKINIIIQKINKISNPINAAIKNSFFTLLGC